jgi:hypothetical protein
VKYGSASAYFLFKSHFAKDGTGAEKDVTHSPENGAPFRIIQLRALYGALFGAYGQFPALTR